MYCAGGLGGLRPEVTMAERYVCTKCGYNMAGYYPLSCPFCGAGRNAFFTAGERSGRFRVRSMPGGDGVQMLQSVPRLGIEHTADAPIPGIVCTG
jgi:hypothetical protein